MAQPLAYILRPTSLNNVYGQDHLVGPDKAIFKMVKADKLCSMIFWGPPGTGKTTIAKAISQETACDFKPLNATEAKVADVRKVIEVAESRLKMGTKTIVFIDEIHRFSKSQQDVLLPAVEDGTIILIGATTEKPAFSVNAALLSRMLVFEVKPLTDKAMMKVLLRVIEHYKSQGKVITISPKIIVPFLNKCSGDARKLVTIIEAIVEVMLDGGTEIKQEHIEIAMPEKHMYLDPAGNEHFDLAHCYQEAIQHSDADAAIYWLAKWLASGEEPAYIARRMLISAFEDASSNPYAILSAQAAVLAVERTGMPECKIPMAHATIEIARSPRNRCANNAIAAAMDDVMIGASIHVPAEMRAGAGGHGDSYVAAISKKYVHGWVDRKIARE